MCRRRRRSQRLLGAPSTSPSSSSTASSSSSSSSSLSWWPQFSGALCHHHDHHRRRHRRYQQHHCPQSSNLSSRTQCGVLSYGTSVKKNSIWTLTLLLLLLILVVGHIPLVGTSTGEEHVHVVVVHVGDPVTLPCDVRTETCGPSHSVKWYKNEQRVYLFSEMGNLDRAEGDVAAAGLRASFVTNATPPYFHLQWTELSDEAQYRCEVTYIRVQDQCPTVTLLNLTVLDPPSPPEVRLNDILVNNGSKLEPSLEGDRLNLSCVSRDGKPSPVVSWWIGNQRVTSVISNSTLNIEKTSHDDDRVFLHEEQNSVVVRTLELTVGRRHMDSRIECRVEHDAFLVPMTTWFHLNIQVAPSSLELLGPRQPVLAGTQVILSCVAEGAKPAADIIWYNGTSSRLRLSSPRVDVNPSEHGTRRTESRLVFNVTRFEHLTNFTCRANNSVTKQRNEALLEQSISLEVLYPPLVWIIPDGNITVKEHDSVTLTCDYKANPPNLTHVVWLKGSEPLILTNNHQTLIDVNSGRPRLIINNVTRTDQGLYRCALENTAGMGTSTSAAQLGIQHPPEVLINISPVVVNETERTSVRFRCDILRANPHALNRVKWYMDGKLLNETVHNELVLTSVTRHQHGDYSCKAHNMAGWGVVSQAKHLVVNYPPGQSFLSYSPKIVIKRENVSLLCTVDDLGRPPASHFRWMRGKRLIKDVTSGNWTIAPVTLSTEGNFTCVGVNDVGEGKPANTYIDVHVPPTFIDRLPHYQGVLVTASSLSMTCRVECDPSCTVEWLRNDLLIEPSQYYSLVSTDLAPDPSTDDFQSVNSTLTWHLNAWPGGKLDRYQDNANFTCRSSQNIVGLGVSSTAYFRVEYPPENISVHPSVLDVVEGEVADKLHCKAYSYPESTYIWLLGNHSVGHGEVLHLPGQLSRDRGGVYTCVASNGRGNISATARVNVLYKPNCHVVYQSTARNKVRLTCNAQGNPSTLHFTWGFGNVTLSDELIETRISQSVLTVPNSPAYVGTYFCIANNSVGFSSTCSLDIAGWATETQGWLEILAEDNLMVVSVVVAGVTVFVMITCCIIIVMVRRRKSQRKYNDNVELEERENADGQIQLPDGTGPGRPCGLNPSVLPHKCNGSDVQNTIGEGNVPTLYKQICPGVLLPGYKKVDGTREVDACSISKSHLIIEHESANKKHTIRTKHDGTHYPDLPIVLDVNHMVNTSAWGSQHEDIKTIEYITAPHI